MAGRQWQPPPSRSKSPLLLLLLLLSLAAAILILIFSAASSRTSAVARSSSSVSYTSAKPETSFLVSLEHFLASHQPSSRNDTARIVDDDAVVARFDESVSKREGMKLSEELHYPMALPVRVYVYEMPRKFTYDLLKLFLNTYRDTTNLTSNGSPVHRLIEQHSVDYWLWADLLAPDSERPIRNTVVRVYEQEDADLFYIPFLTTISFFLLEKQQCRALYRVKS